MTFPPPVPESVRARCPQCGAEMPPAAVSCPACHALIHAERYRLQWDLWSSGGVSYVGIGR